ncbi:MAG: AAA family ATPase, partial [Bacteroidota bacterium]
GKYYFLSRPRRFGKSLLISTLQSLFLGEKELFEGLWIYDKHDFEPRPVILLSFNDIDFREQSLETSLSNHLEGIAAKHGLTLTEETAKEKFSELIQKMGKERQVAVLVDEYDKPIIDYFDKVPQAVENREVLRNFFGVLKGLNVVSHLHFVFITGVSKFTKVSLFSELNHLSDITIDRRFAGMLGITQAEMEANFADRIELLQQKMGMEKQALLDRIKEQYNGYSWDAETLVYNPFSLLRFFASETFGNYWFTSGTASFLIKAFKTSNQPVEALEEKVVTEPFFDKYDVENFDLYSLMWQTGYLTIRKIEGGFDQTWFILGFPNNEVRNAFNNQLLELYANKTNSTIQPMLYHAQKALLQGNPDAFVKELKAIFSDIAYEMHPKDTGNSEKLFAQWEGFFQAITTLTVKVLGVGVQAEVSKSHGRIDAIFETPQFIYIVEFKLEDTADNALKQIKDKHYPAAYSTRRKPIFLIGISFSASTRNVSDYKFEKLEPMN